MARVAAEIGVPEHQVREIIDEALDLLAKQLAADEEMLVA
jgi:hypothetical protein